MREWILSNELAVRLGVFVGIFGLMAVWEVLAAATSCWRRPLKPV